MLSIIINHYRSPEVLKLCLKHLKQNAPEGAEFIVTDSETMEKTELMMRCDFPEIKFLPAKENIGFAKSVNKGLAISHGDYTLLINADVIISLKETIPKMLGYMKANPQVGILGPRLLNINGEHQPSCFRFYSPLTILARRTPFGKTMWGRRELERFILPLPSPLLRKEGELPSKIEDENPPLLTKERGIGDVAIPVDWLMGSALLVYRKAYEQVGGLCEDYFMYMEDVDWCRTFWEKGWRVVYYPEVFFYHYHFQASKKRGPLIDLFTNTYARTHLLSAIKYFKKYGLKVPGYGI